MDGYEMAIKLDPENAESHREHWLTAKQKMEAEKVKENKSAAISDNKSSKKKGAGKKQGNNNKSSKTHSASDRFISSGGVMDDETKRKREQLIHQKEADKYKSKGNAYMSERDYVRAVEAYSTAINLCPNGPSSYVYFCNRSAALCYLEQYEEAELDAAESVSLKPEYAKAHGRLGLARFFLQDYEGAIEAYEKSLFYDPNNAASKSYLAKAKKLHALLVDGA